MEKWRLEFQYLQNVDLLESIMGDNLQRNPKFYQRRMELLDDFFEEYSSPVDIVLVLYGALTDAHHLAFHLRGNNLLAYRPAASHKSQFVRPFLVGETHPERALLIFDCDMVSGGALKETRDYFIRRGYNRRRIFGYLDDGCKWRGYKPELNHVDELLRR